MKMIGAKVAAYVFTNDLACVRKFVSIEISFYGRQQRHKKFIRAILLRKRLREVMLRCKEIAFNGLWVSRSSQFDIERKLLYVRYYIWNLKINILTKSNETFINSLILILASKIRKRKIICFNSMDFTLTKF